MREDLKSRNIKQEIHCIICMYPAEDSPVWSLYR